MLKACHYCGRIHGKKFDCGRKPKYKRGKYRRSEEERGRYTNRFAVKSREIKERSLYLCAVCAESGELEHRLLEVHHIEKIRHRPELLCEDSNLICLCQRCHRKAEKGEISKEFLKKLVRERDGAAPRGYLPLSGESS